MEAGFLIEAYKSDFKHVVRSVFETMLGLALEGAETPWVAASDRVTASVYFVGRWNGALLLECSHSQACFFTQLFLSREQPPAMDSYVQDVLGELANMLAGNLKSILPQGIGISVPSITQGTDYTLRICRDHMVERFGFSGQSGIFWITLVEIMAPA